MAEIDGGTWWWAVTGSAQLVAGLAAYRRGSGGSSSMMPFKAFGVASLFVGSASCAVLRRRPRLRHPPGGRFEAAWSKHTIKAWGPTQEFQQWRTGDLTIVPPPGSRFLSEFSCLSKHILVVIGNRITTSGTWESA